MAGSKLSLQRFADPADLDPGGVSGTIHLVVGGRQDEIGAALGQFRQVRVERAGILRQVFRRPELAGIDVDRRHDDVALGLGGADEAEVPFMQGAHGGDQADLAPRAPQRRQGSAQFGDRGKQSGSGVQVHFLQGVEVLSQRAARQGMHHRSSDRGGRLEDESPLGHAGMRQHERRRLPHLLIVEQEVQVDRSRSPTHVPPSPHGRLDLLQDRQHRLRRKRRLQEDRAVEEISLAGRPAHRCRLNPGTCGQHAQLRMPGQPRDGLVEHSLAITEVGAQSDETYGHDGPVPRHVVKLHLRGRY